MSVDINFIGKSALPLQNFLISLFGPVNDDEKFIIFDDERVKTLGPLLVEAGLFPSLNQVKKNGWDKSLNEGFTGIKFGKNKFPIFVYTPSVHMKKLANRVARMHNSKGN